MERKCHPINSLYSCYSSDFLHVLLSSPWRLPSICHDMFSYIDYPRTSVQLYDGYWFGGLSLIMWCSSVYHHPRSTETLCPLPSEARRVKTATLVIQKRLCWLTDGLLQACSTPWHPGLVCLLIHSRLRLPDEWNEVCRTCGASSRQGPASPAQTLHSCRSPSNWLAEARTGLVGFFWMHCAIPRVAASAAVAVQQLLLDESLHGDMCIWFNATAL